MTKEEKFANEMSELLFQMRTEDLNGLMIFINNTEQIPVDFIDKIINDPVHFPQIKKRIYATLLEAVKSKPSDYINEKGNFHYTHKIYDHAHIVDSYIQEMYNETQTKCLYICTHCNSDNVQVKAWVKPNQGNLYVDEIEGDELGWCDDCNLTSEIQTAELKKNAKVLGFQVIGEDGTKEEGEIHPHMDASFCIYSLEQARAMLDDNNNGDEQWQLLTIWSGDVEEPTFMFEGDPREPLTMKASENTNGLF